MQIRLFNKLLLSVAILAVPALLTSTSTSETIFCSSVLAADAKKLGENGSDGESGEKGRSGRNSDSLTVFADGSPMTLDLSGQNGFPGEKGEPGSNAFCDEQPKDLNKDIQNSNGGDGGDGGDGGTGGNGGSLTVYTTEKDYLKQIYIIATGGEGGAPGAGGEGGNGCKCDTPYWNQETCTGKPGSDNYSCTTSEFECRDGYSGRKGRSGIKGRDGNLGNLTLINLDKSLAPDQPEATVSIQDLKNRGFTVSKNIWETKSGAASLFAPGSVVSDEYQELVARHEHTVLLVWDAPQPISEFEEEPVILSLKGENDANISFPEDLWMESTSLKRDKITELFVFNAIWEDDVAKLKADGIYGYGKNLELDIIDRANKSDVVTTDFMISYRVKNNEEETQFRRIYDYRTQNQGQAASEAIVRNEDVFTIRLGQLDIPPQHLQPGVELEVKITAKRSFGEKSKIQDLSIEEEIEQEEG